MKHRRILLFALVLAVLIVVTANIVFVSRGYHKAFGMHSFNLSGEAFVFDAASGEFIETASLRIKTIQPTNGKMRTKIVFKINDYIDIDALNEKNAEEDKLNGVFRAPAVWYGAYGEGTLLYRIEEYSDAREENMPVTLEPEARLSYDDEKNVFVIGLYYSHSEECRYSILFGFENEQEAAEYMQSIGQ